MDTSVAAVRARFAERRAAQLRPLITEELVTAWARDPDVGHREPLSWVLRFLGQRPPAERVAVYEESGYEEEPGERWCLVHPPARRGATYRLADGRRFTDLTEAREACLRRELHAVFG
ncbi:MAG: hypothetical protein ACRDXB_05800, partial [Actinomycetes bacterium]